ncbi:MAG: hypothetical protein NTZ95_07670 [Candidatus Omnitrophica bacterium]|nr:hypothetical protein [Candidatus Omnitrophota bacterium]
MKTRKLQVLMILMIAVGCIHCAALSFAEQAARYAAEQEGKHMFLAQTREDVSALRSCLMPLYRPAARPELAAATPSVLAMIPSANMVPSLVQPDSTAIAASPRSEITTGSEDKR